MADTSTPRDPYTRTMEKKRMSGGEYDHGPGRQGMPNARDLDRPNTPCGAFDRTGSSRRSVESGIRRIQDQHKDY